MLSSCLDKQDALKKLFEPLTQEQRFEKLIEMGKLLPPFPEKEKREANLVHGCQSTLYLFSQVEENKLKFLIWSEALISAGLAALLLKIYDGESPEVVLKCPPSVIENLGIQASLTPGRSNGLASLYLRMKQDALKFFIKQTN